MDIERYSLEAHDDRQRSGEYPYDILDAGTEDLHQTALERVGQIVKDVPSAHRFLADYLQFYARREQSFFRFVTPAVYPPLVYAVVAIDTLIDARVQNVMADPELASQFGHDRAAIAASYYVVNTPIEVIRDTLAIWQARASR